jgi:hypothetical protein
MRGAEKKLDRCTSADASEIKRLEWGAIMRRIAIILSVLALVGCKTMEQRKTEFSENTDRFIGKNADDLVVAKAPPPARLRFRLAARFSNTQRVRS